jgi:DNA-binding protein H-NS
MPTLTQIQARIAKLQLQAEAIAAKQTTAALDEITKLMSKHGVTTADIDTHLSGRKPRGRAAGAKADTTASGKTRGRKPGRSAKASSASTRKPKLPAKYLNPETGETWSGWARPPLWIKDVKDRSKFLIDGASETTALVPVKGRKRSAKQTVQVAAKRKVKRGAKAGSATPVTKQAANGKTAVKRAARGKAKASTNVANKAVPVKARRSRTSKAAPSAPAVEASSAVAS